MKLGDINLERADGTPAIVRIQRDGTLCLVGRYAQLTTLTHDEALALRLCARTYMYSAELLRVLGYPLAGEPDATPLTEAERERLSRFAAPRQAAD